MLASSLLGILAQRLVRVICSDCREQAEAGTDLDRRRSLGMSAEDPAFVGKGCAQCRQTGYTGRVGIFELLNVDNEIKELIHEGAKEMDLAAASQQTNASLLADGRRKISAGVTDIAEVFRASQDG